MVRDIYPGAIVGGTGWDLHATVEQHGVTTRAQDYTLYPAFRASIGFTQRGCRLSCSFCVVPRKEGRVAGEQTVAQLWRGEPWPRELHLLDNDFFGQPHWRERVREIREGGFKVCFNQGFNVRLIGEEEAEAIAALRYYDDSFTRPRLYTAWDNRRDEALLFRNLEALVRHGVRPDHILVYVLIGYDHATKQARPQLHPDDLYRHQKLRAFGCRPYPMPFCRTPELVGFQRWIVRRADLKVPWEEFRAAHFRPENLRGEGNSLFDDPEIQ